MGVIEFLLQSIPLLISLFTKKYKEEDLNLTINELENEFNVPKIKEYDFIVEGGGPPPPASAVNYFSGKVGTDPDINYFFNSVPQNNAGIQSTPTGKMLGGSGSHNDCGYSRGSPIDYDNYATITGDSSFNYQNMIQYFKKMESFIGQRFGEGDEEYYGTTGPIQVDTDVVPYLPLWFKAGEELGFPTADPNGFQRKSFAPMNKAIGKDGQRSSSYSTYIKPFEGFRNNLTVVKYANVSEILINKDKKAYGVAYTRHQIFPQIAYATKEVIISSGTFSSPLLLMKSGVGPANVLNGAGIPVKQDLPSVGKNLQEHASYHVEPFHLTDPSGKLFLKINPEDTERIVTDFHNNGTGIFTMLIVGPQCFAVSSKSSNPKWPDLQIQIVPKILTSPLDQQTAKFYVILARPKSRGFVTLNTTAYQAGIRNDEELAIIDFGLLSHPDDVEAILEGVKLVFRIAEETSPFKGLNMTFEHINLMKNVWNMSLGLMNIGNAQFNIK